MSRWAHWSRGTEEKGRSFGGFLAEGGTYMSGDPNEIAQQNGWTGDNFGWYRDKNGRVVARSIGGKMVVYNQDPKMGGQTGQGMQTDMGNPAVTAGQKPADRARTMGLQSNGRGGYIDPDTGQVKARTVNGELVFYDDNGGAISDGAGGMALTQSSPSWVDPVSGLILVPPAQPESPQEVAAVPSPTPASAPMGYDKFINDRHKELYRRDKAQREIEAEVNQKQEDIDQKYQSNSTLNAAYVKLNILLKAASESGDTKKEDVSNRVREKLEQRADEFAELFDLIGPEHHDEIADLIPKILIQGAKWDWFKDNMLDPIDNDTSLSKEERAEQSVIAFADPDHGKRHFAKLSENEARLRELMNHALNVNKDKEERTLRVPGKLVYFELTNRNDPTRDPSDLYPEDHTTPAKKSLLKAAKKELKKYDTEPNGEITQISWDRAGEEVEDIEERREIAIDALRTWKRKILPSLKPGTIVYNDPQFGGRGDNQRERIYQLAGFGERSDKYNGQYGIVVEKDGKPVVMPLFGKETKKRGLEEQIMKALHFKISITEEKEIYTCLFS
jgi:hypothetical protein